jgi:hypothetical protein
MTTIDKLTKTPAPNTVYETVNKLIDAVEQGGGGGGGTATDVQINGTSITSNNVANIITNSAYNSTSNKIATMSDIPTVNDATITIQKNSTTIDSFSANQPTAKTINITVPTDTSDLTNDSGFITGINNSDVTTALGYTPENQADKVTVISSQSTDTQYPSAKSVVELLKTIYPVGAIFIGTTATCPMSALFGTWERVAGDRCLQGASTNHSANTTISAGLPNIEGGSGNFVSTTSSSPESATDGAITTVKGSGVSVGSSGSTRYMRHITFSASDSNSIYGNSTTVQPPAYVVNVWRRTA